MPTANAKLIPALLIPFFAWRVYRRFQRNVGQQPLRKSRLVTGIVVFGLISLVFLAGALAAPQILLGFGGGLALGVGLAFVGLRLTHFETTPAGHFYTPNTVIGVALSVLFAGRILYRFGVLYLSDQPRTVGPGAPALFQSALTLFILGLTAGYFVTFNSGVLIIGGRLKSGKR
jgi:hypothetical protein